MSQTTTIEWTETTWNPVTGCSKVSPGCAHCYAETISLRFGRSAGPWTPANATENVVLHPERLAQPLSWRRPRLVFVNSMSDLFHEQVPDEFIAQVFSVMRRAERHTFQVLTKRPERMRDFVRRLAWKSATEPYLYSEGADAHAEPFGPPFVCPNVWLGVSIENRRFVYRAGLLRGTPATVRFISAEPLLGPLIQSSSGAGRALGRTPENPVSSGSSKVGSGTTIRTSEPGPLAASTTKLVSLDLAGIDWLIVGGESGARHRPIDPRWVRDLRDASLLPAPCRSCDRAWNTPSATRENVCRACGGQIRPAFFFKQWGGRTPKAGGRDLDGRTWDEMPAVQR